MTIWAKGSTAAIPEGEGDKDKRIQEIGTRTLQSRIVDCGELYVVYHRIEHRIMCLPCNYVPGLWTRAMTGTGARSPGLP
jgi:ribosomal protein S27E